MYTAFFKRFLDFLLATFGFVLLSPIFLIVTILLFFANNGKPFFFQRRPGKNEIIFNVIKFKTMNDRKDAHGKLLPDGQRLTSFGKFVRKTSIDEIPQLINVIKGDMSLIGPRPLLVKYLPRYTERQRLRHNVRPGITGWAQVNGRNAIGWNERFELDIYYVENVSFAMDIKIIFMTVYKVFKSEGITSTTSATMEEFLG